MIISSFTADEKQTVTVDDLIAVHPCSRTAAHQILSRLRRKGWLNRLKRGVYAVVPLSSASATPAIDDAWALAMTLFAPAFVSGWSAAEHWDLTEQVFNSVAIVTTRSQRRSRQTVGGVRFTIRTLPEKRFFGSVSVWSGSTAVMVADPSRMVVDILDAPRFGGGGRHTADVVKAYWRSAHRDSDQLLSYALRFGRGTVFKRLGFIAEAVGAPVSAEWLESCRRNMSRGISRLDPDVPDKGRVSNRWRLRINLPMDAR